MKLTRRNFLKLSGLTGTSIVGGYLLSQTPDFISGYMTSNTQLGTINPDFHPDVDILIRAQPDAVPILDGQATSVWRYTGEVLAGSNTTLQTLPETGY